MNAIIRSTNDTPPETLYSNGIPANILREENLWTADEIQTGKKTVYHSDPNLVTLVYNFTQRKELVVTIFERRLVIKKFVSELVNMIN